MQMTAMSNETQLAAFKQEGVNTCKKKKKKKEGGRGANCPLHGQFERANKQYRSIGACNSLSSAEASVFFYFSITAIFMGKPSGSFCEGESL